MSSIEISQDKQEYNNKDRIETMSLTPSDPIGIRYSRDQIEEATVDALPSFLREFYDDNSKNSEAEYYHFPASTKGSIKNGSLATVKEEAESKMKLYGTSAIVSTLSSSWSSNTSTLFNTNPWVSPFFQASSGPKIGNQSSIIGHPNAKDISFSPVAAPFIPKTNPGNGDAKPCCTGAIIYRFNNDAVEFLLFNDSFSQQRQWSPLKVEIQDNEDDLECILRELKSLTGLSDIELHVDESFKVDFLDSSSKDQSPTKMTYFLTRLPKQFGKICPPGEGYHFAWLSLRLALEKAVFKNIQDGIKKAHDYIELNKSFLLAADVAKKNKVHLNSSRNSGVYDLACDEDLKHGNQSQSYRGHPLFKTRLCERFQTEGFCPYGEKCSFAHGSDDLREIPLEFSASFIDPNFTSCLPAVNIPSKGIERKKGSPASVNPLYKTKLCEKFMKEKFCQYGSNCHFAHGEHELKQRPNFKEMSSVAALVQDETDEDQYSAEEEVNRCRKKNSKKIIKRLNGQDDDLYDLSKKLDSLDIANIDDAIEKDIISILKQPGNILDNLEDAALQLEQYAIESVDNQRKILTILTTHLPDFPQYLSKSTAIFKCLYDYNIVEDDSILDWFEKTDKTDDLRKGIYKKIRPLIEWLKTVKEDLYDDENND